MNNAIKGIEGTVDGKNCIIKSAEKVNGINTITFALPEVITTEQYQAILDRLTALEG